MTHPISFAHYHRNPNFNVKFSVAYTFELNGSEFSADYAIAQCNPRDTFSRKTGSRLAVGRFVTSDRANSNDIHRGTITGTLVKGKRVSDFIAEKFAADHAKHMESVIAKRSRSTK